MIKIFVYGTLKKGGFFSGVLKKSKFMGNYKTEDKFKLLDLGNFPGLC